MSGKFKLNCTSMAIWPNQLDRSLTTAPRAAETASDMIDDADEFQDTAAEIDTEAKKQLNGELKDKIDEDEEAEEDKGEPELAQSAAKEVEGEAKQTKGKGETEDEVEDDEEDEEVFSVEAIRGHEFIKGKLLYEVKWQGYADAENTYEPEEHLLPYVQWTPSHDSADNYSCSHSRQILANYHKKIGGVPQPPMKKSKSKQSLREAPSSDNLPASKRQKRDGTHNTEQVGTWLPKGNDWEDQVDKVETIERNEETNQLMAYIHFKNGKRSKITMDMVYQHCPRPMLRFYEANLKFK